MAMLNNAHKETEVFLHPGDFYFHTPAQHREQPLRLRTLLGSCISVILWHPERRLAGMSHVILPNRGGRIRKEGYDGRYCDESIHLFCQEIVRARATPQQFQVYLVGGGQMFASEKGPFAVGVRNIDAARSHLKQAGFLLRAEHVGQEDYRKVEIDLKTGEVNVTYRNQRVNISTK